MSSKTLEDILMQDWQITENMQKRGSSTLEFLFCAPILVILLFVAMEINERIEQRTTSAIATGNAAWLINPDTSPGAPLLDLQGVAKSDILGAKSTANNTTAVIAQQPGGMPVDTSAVLSYSDSKQSTDSYALALEYQRNRATTNRAKARASVAIGSSQADRITSNMTGVSNSLTNTFNQLVDPPSRFLPTLFHQKDVEELSLSWTTSSQGASNLAVSSIEKLAESVKPGLGQDVPDAASNEYRILAHHSHYLRRDPAFHPSDYKNHAWLGALMGSSAYDNFNKKCFMNFVVDRTECGEENGFVNYIKMIYGLIVFGKTVLDAGVIACIAATLGFGTGACVVPQVSVITTEYAMKEGIRIGLRAAANTVNSLVDSLLNQQQQFFNDIENQINQRVQDVATTASDSVQRALPSPTAGGATSAP